VWFILTLCWVNLLWKRNLVSVVISTLTSLNKLEGNIIIWCNMQDYFLFKWLVYTFLNVSSLRAHGRITIWKLNYIYAGTPRRIPSVQNGNGVYFSSSKFSCLPSLLVLELWRRGVYSVVGNSKSNAELPFKQLSAVFVSVFRVSFHRCKVVIACPRTNINFYSHPTPCIIQYNC
jgi:hypothetical protein